MRIEWCILAVAFFNILCPLRADEIDDLVRAEMMRQKIPGVSIAVVRDGKIIKETGYGLANVEHEVPAKPETIYQSGSVGKQFTAGLVMLLVEDGKIGLDDPISKYLPKAPEAWKDITVRHLLTHTSGLGDPYMKIDLTKNYSDEELMAIEATIPLRFPPGSKWAYSNTGYHVLGFICNKVGGKFYSDQLVERIFKPCGMTTARMINEHDIIPNRSAGYELESGKIKNQHWVSPQLNTTADGSIYLTVRDMAAWDKALLEGKIFKPSSREAMWTPVKLSDGKTHPYGFGWSLAPVNGHKCISHGGAWQGFTTYISRYVDDHLTVIVLTNRQGVNPGRIVQAIAGHYVPELGLTAGKAEKK